LEIKTTTTKIYVYTETCTWVFMVALFTEAKTWQQSRCPSRGKLIKTLVHSHSGILFSA
jgi:hypothetical protein